MALALQILLAYLLGSISGSLLLGKLHHVDIRTMGSGNAGGTNALRTQGLFFALGVVLIDVGKAMAAVAWVPELWAAAAPEQARLACGFAAVVGHCYPVYHGFRGGKGAATAVGALALIHPVLLLVMIGAWLVVLGLTGYVGLATVLAGFSLVPASWWLSDSSPLLVFSLALAGFMLFTHRANLRRLRDGTEHRFERARILSWFGK